MKLTEEDPIVSYEEAKQAKKDGFDELCTHYWYMDWGGISCLQKCNWQCKNSDKYIPRDGIAAPTKKQLSLFLEI